MHVRELDPAHRAAGQHQAIVSEHGFDRGSDAGDMVLAGLDYRAAAFPRPGERVNVE